MWSSTINLQKLGMTGMKGRCNDLGTDMVSDN